MQNKLDKLYESMLDGYALIFARKSLVKLNSMMFNLSLRGLGILNYRNFRLTGEKKLLDVVSKLSAFKNNVIIDVGASNGDTLDLILESFQKKNTHIFAFEPTPEAYKELKSKYTRKNISIFKYACDKNTGVRIFYNDGLGGVFSSFYGDAVKATKSKSITKIKVKTIRLDKFLLKRGIKSIRLLKIDTEGSELEVLKGCTELIQKHLVDIFQIEFNTMNIISRVFLKDILTELPGYSFYRLLPGSVIKLNKYNPTYQEIFAFQNLIAVKENISSEFEQCYEQ